MPKRKRYWVGLGICAVGGCIALLVLAILLRKGTGPVASVQIADGRLIEVESITYGTEHLVGTAFPLEDLLMRVLPDSMGRRLSPKGGQSAMGTVDPSLVLWLNARSVAGGTNVDCQSLRVELVGQDGHLFGESTSSWHGFNNRFWRIGHVFPAYPRTEEVLTVRITPWRTNQPVEFKVPNPQVARRQSWAGQPLPLFHRSGGTEVVLTRFEVRTNGTPESARYETRTVYRAPVWEVHESGRVAEGWEEPEWTAEDSSGNRGQRLAMSERVLRYSATVYPSPTKPELPVLARSGPTIWDPTRTNIVWWNQAGGSSEQPVELLGLFPVETHVFLRGQYQTNHTTGLGGVIGGAPSGWVGQSRRASMTRVDQWHGHYTHVPVVFVRATKMEAGVRLGVRLRDQAGRIHVAKPEPQGSRDGIYPFLVDLPAGITNLTAELVELRPMQASFDVDTGAR